MVAFGLQYLLDIPIEPVELLAAGGLPGWPETLTQPDRLFTHVLIHGGFAHAYVNASMLAVFGAALEMSLGARGLVVAVVTGALAGGIGGGWFHSALVIVGASSAIWAVVGGLLVVLWARPERLPEKVRRVRSPILLLLLLLLLSLVPMPWLLPRISWAGHFGGFAAGVAVVGWMLSWDRVASRRETGLSVAFAAAVLVAVLSTAVGLHRALTMGREAGLDAIFRLATHPGSSSEIQAAAALTLARDPAARSTRLAVARDVLLARTEREPSLEAVEALAEIHFRLGDLEHAVLRGRERLAKEDSNAAASDLARYLTARAAAGVEAPVSATVRFIPASNPEREVDVHWAEPPRSGAELFAGVFREQRLVALLRFETGPSSDSSSRFAMPDTVLDAGLDGASAEAWLLQDGSASALSPGAYRWRIWPVRSEPAADREPRF